MHLLLQTDAQNSCIEYLDFQQEFLKVVFDLLVLYIYLLQFDNITLTKENLKLVTLT